MSYANKLIKISRENGAGVFGFDSGLPSQTTSHHTIPSFIYIQTISSYNDDV